VRLQVTKLLGWNLLACRADKHLIIRRANALADF
jgi:hypothetical protein